MEVYGVSKPNGYTTPLNERSVAYQVMQDQPVVKLIDVRWMEGDPDEALGYGSSAD